MSTASVWGALVATFVVAAQPSPSLAASGSVRVQVLSAVVKDERIVGATVILQKNGAQSVTSVTDTNGDTAVTPGFSEKDEGVLLLVKKGGYSTLVAKCPCDGMTYAISPVMTALDGLRVVLNWGATPLDLDSHLAYPGSHIYWDAKVGRQANLDVDDVDSYGPETITVQKKRFGEKYVYAVHSYTDTFDPDRDSLSFSRAKVFVYIGQTLIRSYYVPANQRGNLWVVFEIDGQGEFHDVNVVKAAPSGPQLEVAALNVYLGGTNVVQPASVAPDVAGDARRLNKLGEDAYHSGQLDDAISYYRQALDLDSAFGQAYSNLGLAYQKADRIAEAIWANRKAIALASGTNANVVRASSYYNVARIYERAGQFQDALAQYELAHEEKPDSVYEKAIARMKSKLGL